MANRGYRKGDWKAICDICGFEYLASELRKNSDGLMVCKWDYEDEHPQDHVRSIKDRQKVPWTRPDPDPVYATTTCTSQSRSAVPGYGTPGCMIVGCNFVTGYLTPKD